MQCVRYPSIFILMVVVLCGPVSSQSDRDQDQEQYQNQDLEHELRNHQLLQRARSAGLLTQEWSKRAVEDLLAQMSLPETNGQREAEIVSTATGGRRTMERSIEPPNNIPRVNAKPAARTSTGKALLPVNTPPSGGHDFTGPTNQSQTS